MVVESIFGKFRGVIHVLIDSKNRAGLRYSVNGKSGRWRHTLYCWDLESFDAFIKRIEKKWPANDSRKMSESELKRLLGEVGMTQGMLSRLTGLSKSKVAAWVKGESRPSRVATRKIKEAINDYRKTKPKPKAAAVHDMDDVRKEVGGKVQEAVRGDRPRPEGMRLAQGYDVC